MGISLPLFLELFTKPFVLVDFRDAVEHAFGRPHLLVSLNVFVHLRDCTTTSKPNLVAIIFREFVGFSRSNIFHNYRF